jgi:hypothetical protein
LLRLHAQEDASSMQASLALSVLRRGRLEEAQRILEEIGEVRMTDVTAGLIVAQVWAELALVRGDVEVGLAAFDRSLDSVRDWGFGEFSTNRLEPWTLIALATDLAAHTRYAVTSGQRAHAAELAAQLGDMLEKFPTVPDPSVDFPISGMALAALGIWLLTRDGSRTSSEAGVRLVALAQGFGYNRWFPVMDWDHLVGLAETAAPGRLTVVLEEYAGRQGRELRPEAERVLAEVLGSGLTSSA